MGKRRVNFQRCWLPVSRIGLHRRGVERVNCGPKLLDLGEKGVYSSYTLTAEWAGFSADITSQLKRLYHWLVDNQPSEHRDDLTLVHGDSNLANYMFRNDKLVAILDWEIAGIINPSMDIVIQCDFNDYCRRISPPEVRNIIPTKEQWISRYEELTGKRLADFEYWRKVASFTGLIIMHSILRSIPLEHQAAYSQVLDPLWAVANSP